jgi:hypothetical protein
MLGISLFLSVWLRVLPPVFSFLKVLFIFKKNKVFPYNNIIGKIEDGADHASLALLSEMKSALYARLLQRLPTYIIYILFHCRIVTCPILFA